MTLSPRTFAALAWPLLAACSSVPFDLAPGAEDDAGLDASIDPVDAPIGGFDAPVDSPPEGTDVAPAPEAAIDSATEPTPDAAIDSGDEAAIDTDAGGSDTGTVVADTALVDTGPPCTLGASPIDVWVDGTSTKPSKGSIDCPFHTIREATVLPAPLVGSPRRTIHVQGGTATGVAISYNESAAIEVKAGVTLLGAGPKLTRIQNGGACPTGGTCVVLVDADAVFEGFTVSASTGGSAVVTNVGLPAPIVRDALATGASGGPLGGNFGLSVLGSAELGPGISVSNNTGIGVRAGGSGTLHVASGGENHFDANPGSGIAIDGLVTLVFDQGTASGDGVGIRLANVGAVAHRIVGLTASGNASVGVVVIGGASLTLRGSTFTKNRVGLSFTQSSINGLDLGKGSSGGSAADPGGNVFGGVTSANTVAGVCVDLQRAAPAVGNAWSSCAPKQVTATTCDLAAGLAYADVYLRLAAGASLDLGSCAAGP